MKKFFFVLTLLAALGCSDSIREEHATAELQNIARCFEATVVMLQIEPETATEFAGFLLRGKQEYPNARSADPKADFDALRWTARGSLILASSREVVQCRIAHQEHDNFGPEGTAWRTEYEFYVSETGPRSTISIGFSMK